MAAIMASSYNVSDRRCISFAHIRKAAESIESTLYVAATMSNQASISVAFALSCSRVNSIPA